MTAARTADLGPATGFGDDWAYLTIDERKRLVGTIFETITASEDDLDFAPREAGRRTSER